MKALNAVVVKSAREATMIDPPIPLSLRDLLPPCSLFLHRSMLHGQAHVGRVMVHAFRLIEATRAHDLAPALWAAVYLHDLGRTSDGWVPGHGADSWARLAEMRDVRDLFARGGVKESDYPAIETAVVEHSRSEVPKGDPRHQLATLLKDADGLDRVRLGDLQVRYLRNPQSVKMAPFAQRLFAETDGRIPVGDDYFERLWPEALRLLGDDDSKAGR